jgi:hypothetical protein
VPLDARALHADLVAYYEPSAHFQFSRRVRNEFDQLAREYSRNTWLLGRYGGRPNMQTDIAGIGIASRVEIGRLVLREGSQHELLRSALQMFRECQDRELASGAVSRIVTHFPKADERPRERTAIRRAFVEVFPEEGECTFLGAEQDTLELGKCVAYQSLTQYLREDGIYHSAHRGRIDKVQRHLHQEVGRYENHRFFLRPERPADGAVPAIAFCYTGDAPDARVEAFMEGYTGEKLVFVPAERYQAERDAFTGLEDYERASRRFGGKWILQGDVVRLLMTQQVSVLYLFFDSALQPELERGFSWDEIYARQRASRFIARASRNSQTFLEMVLEGLERNGFLEVTGERFALAPGFADYHHVTFYQLGEYHKRQRL